MANFTNSLDPSQAITDASDELRRIRLDFDRELLRFDSPLGQFGDVRPRSAD